ncbi:MAG TPA: hypothetical protein VN300_12060, partial [Desulfobacterales bacterium]|nr:hypothetical protein [Desulfobacterales bacterium]
MGRHQKGIRGCLQHNLQQVAGVEPQNRPAVGMDVSYAFEPKVQPPGGFQVRHDHQVMVLASATVLFVNIADF